MHVVVPWIKQIWYIGLTYLYISLLIYVIQFKASGMVCRSATGECDITEYCNGTSGEVHYGCM